jgi:hypothetical protein
MPTTPGPHLPIQAALLQYPSVKHYIRSFPENDALPYMDLQVKELETRKQEQALERQQWLLEKHGLAVACSEGFSPYRMSAAFIMSAIRRWKIMFQREHGPYTSNQLRDIRPLEPNLKWPSDTKHEDDWDCIERAMSPVDLVDHAKLPNVFIFYGNSDGKCPYNDREDFNRYSSGSILVVTTRTHLLSRRSIGYRQYI